MANFTSSSETSNDVIVTTTSFSGASDDAFEDACCICLESFSSNDPSTITNCKHEYHLQCILDWGQRSQECPICCQLLVLNDPVGQELLAGMATERLFKWRNMSSAPSTLLFNENFDIEHDSSHSDDSDFDDLIMQHLAAAASRARYVHRRERQRSLGLGPPQVSASASASPEEIQQQTCLSSPGSSDCDSPSPGSLSESHAHALSPAVSLDQKEISSCLKPRILISEASSGDQQNKIQPEGFSFPDSIKSKFSATSAKYKESIWRSTQGIKEKLLNRNNSVKELGRGVKREMSAGIAGVARMIERLDLASKRNSTSVSFFSCHGATSNSNKGKNVVRDIVVTDNLDIIDRTSSGSPSCVSPTVPDSVEVSLQRGD